MKKKTFIEYYKSNREMKSWSSLKSQYVKTSHWISFWNSLDDILDGNKLYDLYYLHIWTPIWNVFYDTPRTKLREHRENKDRGKNGFTRSDVYDLRWYIKELFYKMLKEFINAEYGGSPVNWEERNCQTHDKRLYNVLNTYISAYDNLMEFYDQKFPKTDVLRAIYNEKERKLEQELQNAFNEIITKELDKLWL